MAKADYSEKIKELKGHQYQFENIVFEGGGAKGMAYVGVMEVSVQGSEVGGSA